MLLSSPHNPFAPQLPNVLSVNIPTRFFLLFKKIHPQRLFMPGLGQTLFLASGLLTIIGHFFGRRSELGGREAPFARSSGYRSPTSKLQIVSQINTFYMRAYPGHDQSHQTCSCIRLGVNPGKPKLSHSQSCLRGTHQ